MKDRREPLQKVEVYLNLQERDYLRRFTGLPSGNFPYLLHRILSKLVANPDSVFDPDTGRTVFLTTQPERYFEVIERKSHRR